jgi:hypothetical protein
VESAGVDVCPVSVVADMGRGVSLDGVAEPQLASLVVPPAPQSVVEADSAAMEGTRAGVSPVGVAADPDRRQTPGRVADPEKRLVPTHV